MSRRALTAARLSLAHRHRPHRLALRAPRVPARPALPQAGPALSLHDLRPLVLRRRLHLRLLAQDRRALAPGLSAARRRPRPAPGRPDAPALGHHDPPRRAPPGPAGPAPAPGRRAGPRRPADRAAGARRPAQHHLHRRGRLLPRAALLRPAPQRQHVTPPEADPGGAREAPRPARSPGPAADPRRGPAAARRARPRGPHPRAAQRRGDRLRARDPGPGGEAACAPRHGLEPGPARRPEPALDDQPQAPAAAALPGQPPPADDRRPQDAGRAAGPPTGQPLLAEPHQRGFGADRRRPRSLFARRRFPIREGLPHNLRAVYEGRVKGRPGERPSPTRYRFAY